MWNAIKFILVYLGLQLAVAIAMGIVAAVSPLDMTAVLIPSLIISCFLFIIYFVRKKGFRFIKQSFVIHPWRILLFCVPVFLFYLLPEMKINEMLDAPDVLGMDFWENAFSPVGLMAVGVLGPFAEELLFRGAVLPSLLNWDRISGKPWLAIVFSAALFCLAHLNPAQMPFAFMLGLLLGWLYYRTGSLLPGLVIHVINNSLICVVGILSLNEEDSGAETLADLFGSPALEYLAEGVSLLLLFVSIIALVKVVKEHYPDSPGCKTGISAPQTSD